MALPSGADPARYGNRAACKVFVAFPGCLAAEKISISSQSPHGERRRGPPQYVRVSLRRGATGPTSAARRSLWTSAVWVGARPSAPRQTRTKSRYRACVAIGLDPVPKSWRTFRDLLLLLLLSYLHLTRTANGASRLAIWGMSFGARIGDTGDETTTCG